MKTCPDCKREFPDDLILEQLVDGKPQLRCPICALYTRNKVMDLPFDAPFGGPKAKAAHERALKWVAEHPPTGCTAKLVAALKAANAPGELILRAERNEFHDFKSESSTPCIDLARALADALIDDLSNTAIGLVRRDALDGAFDASKEEADEWAASPEGKAITEAFNKIFPPR